MRILLLRRLLRLGRLAPGETWPTKPAMRILLLRCLLPPGRLAPGETWLKKPAQRILPALWMAHWPHAGRLALHGPCPYPCQHRRSGELCPYFFGGWL